MGISMRGMQAFRWMSTFPDFMDKAMPIDGSPHMTSFDLLQWQTHHDIVKMMQAGGMHQAKIAVILSRVGLLTLFTPEYFVEQVPATGLDQFVRDSDASYTSFDVNDYVSQLEAMIDHDLIGGTDESITDFVRKVAADVLIMAHRKITWLTRCPVDAFPGRSVRHILRFSAIAGTSRRAPANLNAVTAQVAAFLATE